MVIIIDIKFFVINYKFFAVPVTSAPVQRTLVKPEHVDRCQQELRKLWFSEDCLVYFYLTESKNQSNSVSNCNFNDYNLGQIFN